MLYLLRISLRFINKHLFFNLIGIVKFMLKLNNFKVFLANVKIILHIELHNILFYLMIYILHFPK